MSESTSIDAVVVGALAYDQIATSRDPVADQQSPILNFKLERISEAFGGCGANVAYNFAQLGTRHQLITCTGTVDQRRYLDHCQSQGVTTDGFLEMPGEACSRALIITDPAGRQITGFFPGPEPDVATWQAHLEARAAPCRIWIQAPYPAPLMLASLQHAKAMETPPLTIWNPGQYAEILSANDVLALLELSDWVIVNRHELAAVEAHLDSQLVICTNGSEEIEVRLPNGPTTTVAVPPAPSFVDPTGCGDTFTASMVHFLTREQTHFENKLIDAIGYAIDNAAVCLASNGPQRHELNDDA